MDVETDLVRYAQFGEPPGERLPSGVAVELVGDTLEIQEVVGCSRNVSNVPSVFQKSQVFMKY